MKLKPGIPLIDQVAHLELQIPYELKFPHHFRVIQRLRYRQRSLRWFFVSNQTIGFMVSRKQWEKFQQWAKEERIDLGEIGMVKPAPKPVGRSPRPSGLPARAQARPPGNSIGVPGAKPAGPSLGSRQTSQLPR